MAKPPECANCNKPATVHLTQIVNNQVKKLDFCDSCPYQKGITDPEGFSLAELLAQGPVPFGKGDGTPTALTQVSCPSCGFKPEDFKKHHRFGCPDCYKALEPFVEPMVQNMQAGSKHAGKVPARFHDRLHFQQQLDALQDALDTAIREERYEDAAKLRDDVRKLREADTDASTDAL